MQNQGTQRGGSRINQSVMVEAWTWRSWGSVGKGEDSEHIQTVAPRIS